jgi:hypothetical protein
VATNNLKNLMDIQKHHKLFYLMFFLFICFLSTPIFAKNKPLQVASPDEKPVVPFRGLIFSAKDIRDMRRIAHASPKFYKIIRRKYLKIAKKWLHYTDAEIIAFMPHKDAVYAYGIAGDPRTDQPWARFGERGICKLDKPHAVVSPKTGHVYGIQKKGEVFFDDGKGWRRKDGRVFYFKGIWNAFIVRKMHKAIDKLAIAYALTGNERIAKRALLIFNYLAMLRPLSNERGPIDVSYKKNWGFMSYGGNLANQRMLDSVLAFDLLGHSKAAYSPSLTNKKLNIFENVKKNYFAVFEQWNFGHSVPHFQNHQQARVANILGQGLLFGKYEDIKFGIETLYALLDNTIDQDGEYYEVSGMYSGAGRYYISRMIDMLNYYDPTHYKKPSRYPLKEDYPYQLRFGNHPQWYQLAVKSLYHTEVLGRMPNYGDSHVDRAVLLGKLTSKWAWVRQRFLKKLYLQTDNPIWKQEILSLYRQLPKRIASQIEVRYFRLIEDQVWQKNLQRPVKQTLENSTSNTVSMMLGGKVIGILRSGQDKNKRAVFIRGGVNSSHAHDDQMAVILYAKGMEVSGEFGYGLYNRPDHLGFGTRGISHNMVVVNEDLNRKFPKLYKTTPAADVLAFMPKGTAQLIELSAPWQWRHSGVTEYRRAIWLVDVSAKDFYFVDIFRVTGGKTHDYVWNARYLENAKQGDGLSLKGIKLKPKAGIWTLAALNKTFINATFNKPLQSWGERLRPGGFIQNLKIPGEKLGYKGWNPPPGNGYGFIYNVQMGKTKGKWSAIWDLGDKNNNKMRMTMLNVEKQLVIRGNSPTRRVKKRHAVVIARKQQEPNKLLRSQFVNLTEIAANGRWSVNSAKHSHRNKNNVAVIVNLKDGRKDVLLSGRDPSVKITTEGVKLNGQYGFVRFSKKGEVTELMLNHGKSLTVGGIKVKLQRPAWDGKVIKVKKTLSDFQIVVSGFLPTGTQMAGSTAIFSSSGYSHNEYYKIKNIESNSSNASIINVGTQNLSLGRTEVKSVNKKTGIVKVRWPLTLGFSKSSREFDGRELVVVNDLLRTTTIISFKGHKKIKVADPKMLESGDIIEIRAIRAGDKVKIPAYVLLSKQKNNLWHIQANQEILVNINKSR